MYCSDISNRCVKSNDSLTMVLLFNSGIEDKAGSIIQCKISDMPLV